jgi:hypothetical protein
MRIVLVGVVSLRGNGTAQPAAMLDAIWAHATPADGLQHATVAHDGPDIVIAGYLLRDTQFDAETTFRAIVTRASAAAGWFETAG